jgi:hypothetical protein
MGYQGKTINSSITKQVCVALAPIMQFYLYRIDKKVMGAKWSRALALMLWKEKLGLLKGVVLEVLEEQLWNKYEGSKIQRDP